MIDFAGFASGFNAQQERDERRRGELAKAFNEFQRLNPTATADQFQQFIDSMSGGRNYLRGGMPSGAALDAVVSQANTNRERADADREYDVFKRNIELQDALSGAVTGIMLGYDDPGEGGYQATDFTAMQQQLQERFPNVDFGKMGFNPNNMFTTQRRNAAIASRIQEYAPIIQTLVNNAGGRNITAEDLAPFGVPTALIQPLITQANTLEDQRRLTYATERRQDILRTAVEAIQRGDPDVYETIVGVYQDINLPAKDSTFFTNLQAEANQVASRESLVNEREALELGNNFLTSLLDRPGIQSAVVLQDDDDLMDRIAARARALPEADLKTLFGVESREAFEANPRQYLMDYLDEVKQELRLKQRGLASTGVDEASTAVQQGLADFDTRNAASVEAYFGSTSNQNFPPQAGPAGRSAQLAAVQLAQEYEMTPQVLAAMEAVFQSITAEDGTNPLIVAQMVRSDPGFQAAVQGHTVREAKERLGTQIQSLRGSPEIQTFENWYSGEQQALDTAMTDVTDDIATAVSTYRDNPEVLINVLTAIDSQLNNGVRDLVGKWQTLGRLQTTANGGLGWLDIEGGLWDQSKIFGSGDSLEGVMNASVTEIRQRLETELATARAALQQQLNSQPSGNNPALSDNAPAAVEDFQQFTENMDKSAQLESIATQNGMVSAPASYVGGFLGMNEYTEVDRARASMIHTFLRTPRVRTTLMDNPTAYDAFVANPLEFMMTSTDPFVLEFFRSDRGREFAESLNRAVPPVQ
jgi:hypothetical protein